MQNNLHTKCANCTLHVNSWGFLSMVFYFMMKMITVSESCYFGLMNTSSACFWLWKVTSKYSGHQNISF